MKEEDKITMNALWGEYMDLLHASILYQALGVPIQEARSLAEENPQGMDEGMGDWAARIKELISAKSAEEN